MKIELLEEQKLLRDTVRRFAAEVVAPRAREIDESGEFPRAFFTQAAELGLAGVAVPEEYGGAGMDNLAYCLCIEEVSRACASSGVILSVNNSLVCDPLLKFGNEEQKQRWLKPLASGELLGCFALTEPGAGSDAGSLRTTARRDGDDYVLDGHKWFTSGAEGAAFCIVMAVTNPAAAPHARASLLLVPVDTPGYERVRNLPVMGQTGAGWASHGEVRLTGARVPASHRIGEEGAGFALAQERLGPGRIHHCMRWIGICERAFDLMCRRAAGRELAPGEPLASRQLVQAWVAESRAEIDASRLLVLRAAWRIEREGAAAARDDVSLIKFHVAGVLQRVLDRALQTHGAAGLVDETPLAFWWRHERGARIYDGPDEVHKTTVARRILAGYARTVAEEPPA
jgi:acyl-CoA dehydrogenase